MSRPFSNRVRQGLISLRFILRAGLWGSGTRRTKRRPVVGTPSRIATWAWNQVRLSEAAACKRYRRAMRRLHDALEEIP